MIHDDKGSQEWQFQDCYLQIKVSLKQDLFKTGSKSAETTPELQEKGL